MKVSLGRMERKKYVFQSKESKNIDLFTEITKKTNKWGLPGGIVEESEDPPFTAVRETFEETHLKVDIEDLVLLSSDKKVAIYLSIVYNGDVIIDYEHSDWAWVKQEDMTNYDAVPHILEWFEKALKYDKK